MNDEGGKVLEDKAKYIENSNFNKAVASERDGLLEGIMSSANDMSTAMI